MLTTSGNPLNTTATNVNSNNKQVAVNKNLISGSSSGLNSTNEFMLPTINNNNLISNNLLASPSYNVNNNTCNKPYRDIGSLFQATLQQAKQQQPQQQQQQQTTNLIANTMANNLTTVGNTLTNHSNNLSSITPQQHSPHMANLTEIANKNLVNKQLMHNSEFVIYLNRCNQFLEHHMYQQALDEINHALNLVSNSSIARFRKAQALLGLKRFYECEKELWNCISLEPNEFEYRKELIKVKQLALMNFNLNLDTNTIIMAAQKYDTIKEAVDALTWTNSMMDFNYANRGQMSAFANTSNNNHQTSNNDVTSNLMNGWNFNSNQNNNLQLQQHQLAIANRFKSMNQLMANTNNNHLFNNNNNTNNAAGSLVMAINNGQLVGNNVATNGIVNQNRSNNVQSSTVNDNNNSDVASISSASGLNLKQLSNSTSSNLLNSSSSLISNNQSTSNSSPLNDVTTNLANGLNNISNCRNRFNYAYHGLDQQTQTLFNSVGQTTNGHTSSNQNLINNQQQQLFNRILPSFIDHPTTNGVISSVIDQQQPPVSTTQQQSKSNQSVIDRTHALSSKLTLDNGPISPLILNSVTDNGLLVNNNAPSAICLKSSNATQISQQQQQQQSSINLKNNSDTNGKLNNGSLASLANSCNYNIFNQMPEMKLIETIVPNLLGSLVVNSSTSLTDQSSNNDVTNISNHQHSTSPINNLVSSISVIENNSSLSNEQTVSSGKKTISLSDTVSTSASKSTSSSNDLGISDNGLVSKTEQSLSPLSSSNILETRNSFDDCKMNKNECEASSIVKRLLSTGCDSDLTIEALMKLNLTAGRTAKDAKTSQNKSNQMDNGNASSSAIDNLSVNSLGDLTSNPISSSNQIKNCETVKSNNTNVSTLNNNASSCSTIATSTSTLVPTLQCTSYSDIVKRTKKNSKPQSTPSVTSNGLVNNASSSSSKDSFNSSSNGKNCESTCTDDSLASKRPTNLWGYNGLRVANVSLTASKSVLMNLFSKFGRIRLLERIINKATTNNIWVYYDNAVSPVEAVTKLQNMYIENICADSDSPLRLFFAPTDDQKDLKFSRPKQPPDNKGRGECYYWRTTNCFSKEQCPLLHIPANKNIDAQVWMRVNPESTDTTKESEEDEQITSASPSNARNETTTF